MQRWSWAWLALVACWPSEAALAQSRARLGEAILVEPDRSGCITHAAVLARVLHWLKPSVEIGDVEVLVHGGGRPPSFVVRRGTGSPSERRFDVLPARCRDRVDAMALAIALALEEATRVEAGGDVGGSAAPPPVLPGSGPGAVAVASSPRATASEPDLSREANPAVRNTPPPERAPTKPPPDSSSPGRPEAAAATEEGRLHVRLRAGVDGLIEALPEPVLALHAGGELAFDPERRWSVGLDALVSFESDTPVAGGRVLARLYAGRAVACFGWPVGGAALEACAGTGLGAAVAEGEEFASPESTTLFWASVLARAALRYPRHGGVGGRLAIDGFANLARPEYRVKGVGGTTVPTGRLGAAASLELIVALE
jgi:hypothetical protein